MFHIFYNRPIVNADGADYAFNVRVYVDLSDSVSSADASIIPNEKLQKESFKISVNCGIETLTPSTLSNQYSYIFRDTALNIQIPEFTIQYP
jgi:hypothetical protein